VKLLVVNVNTSSSMTATIQRSARASCSPGTEVVVLQPVFGPEGVDCNFESYLAAVSVMDRVITYEEGFDAVVIAGFGEHGRDGLQELVSQPVVEICEAAAHAAMMVGRTYSVITTLRRSAAAIEDRLRLAGLDQRCVSVRFNDLTTKDVDCDPQGTLATIVEEARKAVQVDHAEVICLGCAGMAGLEQAITEALGVPVIDGVAAAVRFAEALVSLGLKTSKVGAYAWPMTKQVVGWPLSRNLRLNNNQR